MSLADLTQFVTLLAAMSVAVERVVEVIKGFITPILNKMSDNVRRAVLQVLAVVCGTIAAYMAQSQFPGNTPITNKIINAQFGPILIGLLTAGGSAFWNHVLDIIGALKTQKEQLAKAATVTLPPAPQVGAPAAPAPQAAGAVAGKP